MKTIFRFLGRKGRTTIPQDVRVACGFKPGDIISFEVRKDGGVLLRKETVCNHCCGYVPTFLLGSSRFNRAKSEKKR